MAIYGAEMVVSPEQARVWLEAMPRQRALRQSRVKRYVDARMSGRWVVTHQGLAFNEEGHLVDGQHRLQMVVETNLPTSFFVVRGVTREAQLHIDTQLPRSIVDALRIAGEGDTTHSEVATATMLAQVPGNKWKREYPVDTIQWILEEDAEAIDFAARVKGRKITRGVRALLARAYHHVDRDRLEEFAAILVNRNNMKDANEDMAALTYWENVVDSGLSASWEVEKEKYEKGQAALEYFLARKRMTRVYGTGSDLYPWPLKAKFAKVLAGDQEEEAV